MFNKIFEKALDCSKNAVSILEKESKYNPITLGRTTGHLKDLMKDTNAMHESNLFSQTFKPKDLNKRTSKIDEKNLIKNNNEEENSINFIFDIVDDQNIYNIE